MKFVAVFLIALASAALPMSVSAEGDGRLWCLGIPGPNGCADIMCGPKSASSAWEGRFTKAEILKKCGGGNPSWHMKGGVSWDTAWSAKEKAKKQQDDAARARRFEAADRNAADWDRRMREQQQRRNAPKPPTSSGGDCDGCGTQ